MAADPARRPSTALYAFSADPITYGHVDVVERVSRTFDRVVVGIGRHPTKRYLFTLEERLRLARETLAHLPSVTVLPFHGMVVDFATEQGAQVIVKGVRNVADFDYEQVHHLVGVSQRAGIDTHVLFADPALAHVSSSAVKAIQQEHGFVHEYVPPVVKAALEEVLCGQLVIGVTGVAGAGKSTLCGRLVEAGRREGLAVHDVDLDRIAHGVLSGDDSPLCARTREALAARFGPEVETAAGVDRGRLAARVFGDPDALADVNRIMAPAVLVGLRKALYGLRGVVLLDTALLAEQGLVPLCNGRVILVDVSAAEQEARLAARGLSARDVRARAEAQWPAEEKRRRIAGAIARSRFGRLWSWDGTSPATDEGANALLHEVLAATGARLEQAPHAA
jgi:pantetheine-phosphate adenylyltransferase/dephospho-CoA kinase